MVGVEHDTREEQGTPAPAGASGITLRGATAIEVAGLRERMDGVNLKLDAVDRRVGALEAARRDDVAPMKGNPSEKSVPASEQSDARATGTFAEGKRAIPAEASGRRPDSSIETSPAGSGDRIDARLRVPVPAPVILMLSDAQFERWLGSDVPVSIGPTLAEEEPHSDWRLRTATRATRKGSPLSALSSPRSQLIA